MGQGSSSKKTADQPGPPKKRKSILEKVAGTVKKLTTKKKKDKGEEPIKNLEDAAKYILKPGGQFGELEMTSKGELVTRESD
ncbi:unnamed protein product [Calypogeia fissa]